MVQIKINPVFKKVKVAKIDYKSVVVQFLCFKSQGYSPTMTVQARASSAVERLTV
jgi:hypothetical protein